MVQFLWKIKSIWSMCPSPLSRPVGSSEFLPSTKSSAVYSRLGWEKLAPLDFDNIKSLALGVIAGDRIGVISGSTQWGGGCCLCVSLSNSHNIEHGQLYVVVVLILPFSIGSIRFVLYSNKCSLMQPSIACAVAADVMHVA